MVRLRTGLRPGRSAHRSGLCPSDVYTMYPRAIVGNPVPVSCWGRLEGEMHADGGNGTSGRGSSDGPDDTRVEPEIVRWLGMYAEAQGRTRDAAVVAILDEVNRLLSRYRR